MLRSFIYPTNNFGHQHNVQYYHYGTYVSQGNNWSSFGLHQVEVRNQTDKVIEVLGWTIKEGRLEEDFRVREVKPALFYTARIVPTNLSSSRTIRGAVTFRVKGTNQTYTLAFEDNFLDVTRDGGSGFRGHIEQGSDAERAIANLRDSKPKQLNWGSYELQNNGRGRSVITFGKRRF